MTSPVTFILIALAIYSSIFLGTPASMPLRNFLVIFAVAVISFACYSVTAKNRYANLFAEVLEIVNHEALKEVGEDKLFTDAMNGMLKDLDKHSAFIANSRFREFTEDLEQEFGGVGMYVDIDPETKMLMVLAPMPNTPAYEAGIQVGDLIVSIAGKTTFDKSRTETVKELRGPVGETVDIEVRRGDDTLFKTLTRAKIPIESAHGRFRKADGTWNFFLENHPKIGYIWLNQFGELTGDETRAALRSLPDDVAGLVLDLRSNPGGLLDKAVEICDMFLEADLPIVRIKGRGKSLLREYTSTAGTELSNDLPICILVDRYSASASEIVSGCLQDHGRAILIGEQSYGKGTVQDIIPIQYNKSLLKLTTASYWRPSNRHIDRNDELAIKNQIWGVQPDKGFAFEMSEEELIENLRQRNAKDFGGLPPEPQEESEDPQDAEAPEGKPENVDSDTMDNSNDDQPSLKVPHVDRPLMKAIEYIKSRAIKKTAA